MLAREYFPSDAIKLINQSEGRLGISGEAAHALSRHLLRGAAGAVLYNPDSGTVRSIGVGADAFRDRFKTAAQLPGGAMPVNSGWIGKGDMAILLCELLNSDVGQVGLGQLDKGTNRVCVHYLNLGKLASLFGGLAGGLGMKISETSITPATTTQVQMQRLNEKTQKTVVYMQTKKIPEVRTSEVKAAQIASVVAVLDNLDGTLHVQTFYPANYAVESHASWRVGDQECTATVDAQGTVHLRMTPR